MSLSYSNKKFLSLLIFVNFSYFILKHFEQELAGSGRHLQLFYIQIVQTCSQKGNSTGEQHTFRRELEAGPYPLLRRLEAMADKELLIKITMMLAKLMINKACRRPTLRNTNSMRKKRMIPKMVKMLGVNIPAKVPKFPPCWVVSGLCGFRSAIISPICL